MAKRQIVKEIANGLHLSVGNYELNFYKKVPEYKGDNISDKYRDKRGYKEWTWDKDKVYSSPRNIRSVYIHRHGVAVLMFTAPKGRKSIRTNRRVFTGGIDSKPNITWTGLPLEALSKPLVCSNVEEIYVDWHVFLEMSKWLGIENKDHMGMQILQNPQQFEHMPVNGIVKSDLPIQCLGANGELLKGFSRLRTVAITDNITIPSNNEEDWLIKPSKDNNYARTFEARIDELRMYGAKMMVSVIDSNNSNYSKLDTSPNIYLFDREVLVPWAQRFEQEFKEAVAKKKRRKSVDKTKETNKKVNYTEEVQQEIKKLATEIERLKSIHGTTGAHDIVKRGLRNVRHPKVKEAEEVHKRGTDRDLLIDEIRRLINKYGKDTADSIMKQAIYNTRNKKAS